MTNEQKNQNFEGLIELARKGLRDKIAAQEKLLSTSMTADEAGHSVHFDLRNMYMEALEYLEEAIAGAQGDQTQLHALIENKIDDCVAAMAAQDTPDEQAKLQGAAEDYSLRWNIERSNLERKLRIWQAVREEVFPDG